MTRKSVLTALAAGRIRYLALVSANERARGVISGMPVFAELSDVMSGMTALQVVSVAQKYATILNDMGAKPFNDRDAKTRENQLNHLRWMCDQTIVEAQTSRDPTDLQKAMRWLGFVQGAFFSLEIRTIDQMRDDNR